MTENLINKEKVMKKSENQITIEEIESLYEKLKINTEKVPKYDTFDEYCNFLSKENSKPKAFHLMANTEVN